MKLSQKQLRQLISEAIEGREAGAPEPYAIQEEMNPEDYSHINDYSTRDPGLDSTEALAMFANEHFKQLIDNMDDWTEGPDEMKGIAEMLAERFADEVAPIFDRYLQRLLEGG